MLRITQGTHYVGRVQRKGVACETARILRWVIFEFSNEIAVMWIVAVIFMQNFEEQSRLIFTGGKKIGHRSRGDAISSEEWWGSAKGNKINFPARPGHRFDANRLSVREKEGKRRRWRMRRQKVRKRKNEKNETKMMEKMKPKREKN